MDKNAELWVGAFKSTAKLVVFDPAHQPAPQDHVLLFSIDAGEFATFPKNIRGDLRTVVGVGRDEAISQYEDWRELFLDETAECERDEREALEDFARDEEWAKGGSGREAVATFRCRRFECQTRWEVRSTARTACPNCGDIGVLFHRHREVDGVIPDPDANDRLGSGYSSERSSRLAVNHHDEGDDGPSSDH